MTDLHNPTAEQTPRDQIEHDRPLLSLARDIQREHEATFLAVHAGLQHARRAGVLLLDVKARLPHGAWLPWITEHCPEISARVAQGYMRIAREWPRLEAETNAKRDSYLPVRTALALLAEPRLSSEADAHHHEAGSEWTSAAAAMEAAWNELQSDLDSLNTEIAESTEIASMPDLMLRADELNGRAITLSASTARDRRRLAGELATLLEVPNDAVLMNPEFIERVVTLCRSRIAELERAS